MSDPKPITITYPDARIAEKIVDILVRDRPVGWSHRSYATYYDEKSALQIKKIVDNMIETKRAKVIRYDMMPNLTPNTIYLWVNRALRYLVEKMDDKDKTYLHFSRQTKIERVRGVGITMSYRDQASEELRGEDFVARDKKLEWKTRVEEWLADPEVSKPLHITNLLLTPDDIAGLKDSLDDLSNVQYAITSREIKIIKVNKVS